MTAPVGPPERRYVGTCPDCRKYQFETRRAARRAARSLYPGDVMRAYQCGQWWHIGHTPAAVRRGERPAGT